MNLMNANATYRQVTGWFDGHENDESPVQALDLSPVEHLWEILD